MWIGTRRTWEYSSGLTAPWQMWSLLGGALLPSSDNTLRESVSPVTPGEQMQQHPQIQAANTVSFQLSLLAVCGQAEQHMMPSLNRLLI